LILALIQFPKKAAFGRLFCWDDAPIVGCSLQPNHDFFQATWYPLSIPTPQAGQMFVKKQKRQ
jgi:hypothetical protein